MTASCAIARVNGVALNTAGENPDHAELRQRACTELLRQAAQCEGLLPAADAPAADGVISEAAAAAIEALLERVLNLPEPSEEACRRHHAAHEAAYRRGERVRARHILFAVTPGVDVAALRRRVESIFLDVRCHDGRESDRFADAARRWSNCPSGERGGDLGWVTSAECAPEFARELFGRSEIGVLPRLVHSRFGLHVVEILERETGAAQSYESVRAAVASALRQHAFVTALRQYLQLLAGNAEVEGVDLEATGTPLVQ
jgi:peptidyl-prolyl cis-trans isomerase C